MDASHRWSSRAQPIDPIWPLVPALLEDEIISSWLVRCALRHGCEPLTLTGVLWPGERFWWVDPDKELATSRMHSLTKMTGIAAESFQASTLVAITSALAGDRKTVKGINPWILCLGSRNRRRSGGLQYCPRCFGEETPYYRIHSRLAWHTCCPVHHLLLIDQCPRCAAPLCPQLLVPPETDLSHCHRCHQRLECVGQVSLIGNALLFQNAADGLFFEEEQGYGDERLKLVDWFYLSRWIIGSLRAIAKNRTASAIEFASQMGLDLSLITTPDTGLPFEYLSPLNRAQLLVNTWTILRAGPEMFVDAAVQSALAPSLLPLPAGRVPPCVNLLMSNLKLRRKRGKTLHHSDGPRSRESVLMMWHRLLRKIQR